jgi:hypothetical protein
LFAHGTVPTSNSSAGPSPLFALFNFLLIPVIVLAAVIIVRFCRNRRKAGDVEKPQPPLTPSPLYHLPGHHEYSTLDNGRTMLDTGGHYLTVRPLATHETSYSTPESFHSISVGSRHSDNNDFSGDNLEPRNGEWPARINTPNGGISYI